MHFIKRLQWFNKGYNLAMLTSIYKNWTSLCSLSHEESKNHWVDLVFQFFIRYKQLFVSVQKQHLFKRFMPLAIGSFS